MTVDAHQLEHVMLLELIKQLENRIIQLESKKRLVMDDDSWYWDH